MGNRVRRVAVEEIKSILEHSGLFQVVGTGKRKALTEEDNFPSCYIKVDGTTAELNGNMGVKAGCEYDLYLDVRIILNLNLSDDLEFLDMESDVVQALLTDNPLWSNVLDREYVGSGWDSDANFPKKEGELGFSIRLRSPA